MQATYLQLVGEGKLPSDDISSPAVAATHAMLKSWALWKYRYKFFDQDLAKNRYSDLRHSVFKIENEAPKVAASSLFSVETKRPGEIPHGVALSIIPTNLTETVVIFSYHKSQSTKVQKYISPIMLAANDRKKHELSYLLIDKIENFFLSPLTVEDWTKRKRKAIEKAFVNSLFVSKNERNDELLLF